LYRAQQEKISNGDGERKLVVISSDMNGEMRERQSWTGGVESDVMVDRPKRD